MRTCPCDKLYFVFFSDANSPPSVTVGDRRAVTSVHIPGMLLRVVIPFPALPLGHGHVRWKSQGVGNNAIVTRQPVTSMGMRLDGLFVSFSGFGNRELFEKRQTRDKITARIS